MISKHLKTIARIAAPALMGAMWLGSSTTAKAATITYNPGGDNNLYCSSAGGTISTSDPGAFGGQIGNGISAVGYSSGAQWSGGTCQGAAAPENAEAINASLWYINSAGAAEKCYSFNSGNWIYNTSNLWGVYMAYLPGQTTPLGPITVNYNSLCGAHQYTLYIQTAVKNTTNGTTTWDYGTFQTPWTFINMPPAGYTG